MWISFQGKKVQLRDVFLPNLTEVEKIVFDKISQDKIMQLGIIVAPDLEASGQAAPKPQKRRVLLLKRKAITTGFFDSSSKGKDDISSKGENYMEIYLIFIWKFLEIFGNFANLKF